MCNFHVKQKVASVGTLDGLLSKGAIYIIREIDYRAVPAFHAGPTVRVEGLILPFKNTMYGLWELGFDPTCFRPIIERKTDISVFQKLLNPPPKQPTKENIHVNSH